MKKVIAILSPIALSLALVTLPASAGQGQHKHRGFHSMLQQLELSEQQRQDIRQTISQSRADRAVYREDLRALREEIKGYTHTDSWNEVAVRELLSQQEHLLATIKLQKAQKKHAVWNLLSAEQQQQWQTLKEQRKAKYAQRKDNNRRINKLSQLDLTPEQEASIEQLKADKQNQKQSFEADYQAFRQAQLVLIQAETFDEQAWQVLWQQNQPLLMNMAVARALHRFNVWNVLTEEQQQQLSEARASDQQGAGTQGRHRLIKKKKLKGEN